MLFAGSFKRDFSSAFWSALFQRLYVDTFRLLFSLTTTDCMTAPTNQPCSLRYGGSFPPRQFPNCLIATPATPPTSSTASVARTAVRGSPKPYSLIEDQRMPRSLRRLAAFAAAAAAAAAADRNDHRMQAIVKWDDRRDEMLIGAEIPTDWQRSDWNGSDRLRCLWRTVDNEAERLCCISFMLRS